MDTLLLAPGLAIRLAKTEVVAILHLFGISDCPGEFLSFKCCREDMHQLQKPDFPLEALTARQASVPDGTSGHLASVPAS